MISGNQGKNFFEAHWDWLAAAAGVSALAAVAVFKFVLADDPEAAAAGASGAKAAKVEPVAMQPFEKTSETAAKPPRIAEIAETKGSFLASGLRVFCSQGDPSSAKKACGLPIPYPVEECPYCHARQKIDEKPQFTVDADADGMKDEWEKKYGLNPSDASDAAADPDGDGFTNLEEFVAGTDPSDKNSHPDYIDSLKVEGKLKQTYTELVFTGAVKTPRGMKLAFKDPARSTDYNRGIYSVFAGEEIGKSGYIAKSCEQKFRKEKMGGGMEKKVDVSEATIVRKSDGKTIVLVLSRKRTPVDVQATVNFTRLGGKSFEVTPGAEFAVNGEKFAVLKIEKGAKGPEVAVENKKTGAKRVIKAE